MSDKRLKEMNRSLKVKSITDKLHSSGVVLDKVIDKLNRGSIAKRKAGLNKGGRANFRGGGRTNLYEELGRVEAEPSNRNRRAEVSRIHGELNKGYKKGGRSGYGSGGVVLKGKKVGIQIK
jgi:hypothetical protein